MATLTSQRAASNLPTPEIEKVQLHAIVLVVLVC